jgi:hypothetical protein
MMNNYSISALLAQHPWLIGVLAVVVVIILALPDDVRVVRRAGRVYRHWRGLLWGTGPGRKRGGSGCWACGDCNEGYCDRCAPPSCGGGCGRCCDSMPQRSLGR